MSSRKSKFVDGDFVQAVEPIPDPETNDEAAAPRDCGWVEEAAGAFPVDGIGDALPLVRFERTGALVPCPPESLEVLAANDFASSVEKTPVRTRRYYVRRGAN